MIIVRCVPDGESSAEGKVAHFEMRGRRRHVTLSESDSRKCEDSCECSEGKSNQRGGKFLMLFDAPKIRRTASFGLFRSTASSCSLAVVINFSFPLSRCFLGGLNTDPATTGFRTRWGGKNSLDHNPVVILHEYWFYRDLWCQYEQVDFVFVLLWMNLL